MGLPRAFRKAALEAGSSGFSRNMTRHFACHYHRSRRLAVTFDHMKSRDLPMPRYPWCFDLLKESGLSHLGILMKRRNDWFRHADLFDFFDELRADGFFDAYDDVLFYGSSMGGYGACAYASAAPGARIFALMPQSTLDRDVLPEETRYRNGFDRGNWDDPRYRDAADGAATASQLQVLYDPYFAPDRRQVERLVTPDLRPLKCFFAGHHATRLMYVTGLLKPLLDEALAGGVDTAAFQTRFRQRRGQSRSALRFVLQAAIEQGHPALAQSLLDSAETRLGMSHPFPALARRLGRETDGLDLAKAA